MLNDFTPPSLDDVRARRANESLLFGMVVALLNFVFWLVIYLIYDQSQLYFSAITLIICVLPYLLYRYVNYDSAAYAFFFSVFVFLIIASLYNPPTFDVVRSQHFFFLPFCIYAYALFYNKPLWFRALLSAASVLSFLFFAFSKVALVTPEQLGLPLEARQYGLWFNALAGALGFAGMVHYVHVDMEDRDNQAYTLTRSAFEDQLELFYQPQVDAFGNIIGAEALLRWKHPTLGILTPDKFIPYAEKTGSIVDIGRWVVQEACSQLAVWSQVDELSSLRLSVNISAREFQESNFVDYVKNAVATSKINSSLLRLEITESALMLDINQVIEKINQLKSFGIQFSLDDLGTGYSTLSLVKDLPVSEIKIDRSFVSDITADTLEMPVTDTLIALGESMKVDSVAEGVETREQWQYLTDKGCHYFQGYFFGKPMGIDMFNQFAHLKTLNEH